jgi:hypothetical protein
MNFYNKNKDKIDYYIKYHHDNFEEYIEFDNKYSLSLNDIPTKFIDFYKNKFLIKPFIDMDEFELERTLLSISDETYEVKYYNFDLYTNIIKNETENKKGCFDTIEL